MIPFPYPVKKELKRTHHRPITLSPVKEKLPVAYLSVDVETNGPVPGLFSMLSIGLCAFDMMGDIVWEREYNLFPLNGAGEDETTMKWWKQKEQQHAWACLMRNRKSPAKAFASLARDLKALKADYKVFCVAWPACFDWMFLQWYMYKFVGDNPLGRSAKCGVTYSWAIAKTTNPNIDISTLLEQWNDPRFSTHTHCALDDAREQGARFVNMLRESTCHGFDRRIIK